MADNKENVIGSFTEDRNTSRDLLDKHQDELSAGAYAGEIGKGFLKSSVMLAAGAAGFFGGRKFAPKGLLNKLEEWSSRKVAALDAEAIVTPDRIEKYSRQAVGIGAGVAAFIPTGMALGYEDWVKMKSQEIAVQDINDDVANAIKIRQLSDDDLLTENDRLRNMLDEKTEKNDALEEHAPKHKLHAKTASHEGEVSDKEHSQEAERT